MSVTRTETENLQSELSIQIGKEQYEPKLRSELNKHRQKAHMKGFRKGKVPLSVIKKMYGKSILAEVINEMIQSELNTFVKDSNLEILGQPLPSEDQTEYDFELRNLQDFEFKFDIGYAPDFEVTGLEKSFEYGMYDVIIPDNLVQEELEMGQKRIGKRIEADTDILEGDMITFNAKELEGEALKPKGFETSFQLASDLIQDEEVKKEVLTKKKGDTVRFNIFTLEGDKDDAYVRKYLLKLEEDEMDREVGQFFEATIEGVSRVEPAALDQTFFDAFFGPDVVKSEEEAREKIRESIKRGYDRQAEALLYRDFQEELLKLNDIQLPDTFLKRWLLASDSNLKEETIQSEYEGFSKNLVWSLIQNRIQKKFEIQVEPDEIKEVLRNRIRQYMGNYPMTPEMLDGSVERLMGDQDQVRQAYDEKMSDKMFDVIKEAVTVKSEPIDTEHFAEIVKKVREEQQKEEGSPEGVNEEEE